MQRTREDHIALLNETVKYYAEDPQKRRSVIEMKGANNNSACAYYGSETKQCAVGRCLDPRFLNRIKDSEDNTSSVGVLFQDYEEEEMFKPEYYGYSKSFWKRLQDIHDGNNNWNADGSLTESGKLAYLSAMEYINTFFPA
jgi:hypothetical protein